MKNYTNSITINSTTNSIYYALTESIHEWWSIHYEGRATKVNDSFKIEFGTSYKKITIQELSSSNIKWLVTDSLIDMKDINNKKEWVGTHIVWNIETINHGESILKMTHIGLYQNLECFEACDIGWASYLNSIKQLIEAGRGNPYKV